MKGRRAVLACGVLLLLGEVSSQQLTPPLPQAVTKAAAEAALPGGTMPVQTTVGGQTYDTSLTWGALDVKFPDVTNSLPITRVFTTTLAPDVVMSATVMSMLRNTFAINYAAGQPDVSVDRLKQFTVTQTGAPVLPYPLTYTYTVSFILDNDVFSFNFAAPAPLTGSTPSESTGMMVRPNHYYMSGVELLTRLNGLLHHFVSPRSGTLISASVIAATDFDGLNVETTLSAEDSTTFDPYLTTFITQIAAALYISPSRIVEISSTSGNVPGYRTSTTVMWTVLNTDFTPAPTPTPEADDGFPAWALGLAIFLPIVTLVAVLGFLMSGGTDAEESPEEEKEEVELQEGQAGEGEELKESSP